MEPDKNPAPADAGDEFDQLEAQARELEGETASADQAAQQQAAAVVVQTEGAADLIEFAWELASPFVPERYAVCYTDQRRAKIATAFAALAVRRGWEFGDMLGKYGAELALLGAVVGPVLPVVMAEVKARREALQAAGEGGGNVRPQ